MSQEPPAGPPPAGVPPPEPQPAGDGWQQASSQVPAAPSDDAIGYLRAYAGTYTRPALDHRLAAAGHAPEAIEAAWSALAVEEEAAGRKDRRRIVSTVIGIAYLGTWLVMTAGWVMNSGYSAAGLPAVLLGFMLAVPGLLFGVMAEASTGLRRASKGRVAAYLVIPMIVLFVLANICASIVPPFGQPTWL